MPGATGDLDRPVDPLLGRDAAQEDEVLAGQLVTGREQVGGRPWWTVALPVGLGSGHRWSFEIDTTGMSVNSVVDRPEVRQVEAAVQGRRMRHAEPPRQREVEVVEVEVDDVEAVGLGGHRLQRDDLVGERVDDSVVKPKGPGTAGTSSRRYVASRRWRTG